MLSRIPCGERMPCPATAQACRPRVRPGRPGFTLTELLVVIAIIGVLATLAVTGVMWATRGQQQSNTENAMRTIQKALDAHWAAVVNDAKKETVPDGVHTWAGGNAQRARVVWIKLRLMEAFPTSYSEVSNPYCYSSGLIPTNKRKYNASYKSALGGLTAANNSATESSACLLLALSVNRGGVTLAPDSLGSFVQDSDGDGIKELVDGWNSPLAFFRFPTGNSELQGLAPSTGVYKDPLDPTGLLFNWTGGNSATFDSSVHKIKFGAAACYIVPTVVSAGPNKSFGLNTDMSISNSNDADDNIMSFRLKLGARGD